MKIYKNIFCRSRRKRMQARKLVVWVWEEVEVPNKQIKPTRTNKQRKKQKKPKNASQKSQNRNSP